MQHCDHSHSFAYEPHLSYKLNFPSVLSGFRKRVGGSISNCYPLLP